MSTQPSTNSLDPSNYGDVEHLRLELSHCLSLQSALETEIAAILQSISLEPCGSLSILPVELLTDIFDHIVTANPIHIGRLMLVCRFWSRIIVQTPQLWTNIQITVPVEPEKVEQCASYCAKCVERSGSLPLDINIRYNKFRALPEDFWEPLVTACATTFDDHQDIQTWWMTSHYNKLNRFYRTLDQGDDPFLKYHRERYLAPLRIFSGKSFSNMTRWRSFSLTSSGDRSIFTAASNANLFGGRTPLLERLVIRYVHKYEAEKHGKNNCIRFTDSSTLPFPFLPKISELLLINVGLPIQFGILDPDQITRLSIHTKTQFPLTCRNLTTLRLGFCSNLEHHYIPTPINPIIFPYLNRLEMSAPVLPDFWKRFGAPVLDVVVFEYGWYLGLEQGVALPPSITRVECRWFHEPSRLEGNLTSFLQILSLDTLLFVRYGNDRIIKVLGKLRDRGFTIPNLLAVPHNNDTDPLHEGRIQL